MNAPMPVSPLMLMREMQEEAERELVASPTAAVEARVQLLRHIVGYIETVTRTAFEGATAEQVRDRAQRLGRESHEIWAGLLLAAAGLMETLEIPVDNFFERAMQGWPVYAQHAETIMPKLPPTARVYVRAVGYFIMNVPMQMPPPDADVSIEALARAVAQAEQDENGLLFVGLLQALFFFGNTETTLPSPVLDALGREFWNLIRGGVENDAFEDAFWSARADEARLEGGEFTSLDDVTRRSH